MSDFLRNLVLVISLAASCFGGPTIPCYAQRARWESGNDFYETRPSQPAIFNGTTTQNFPGQSLYLPQQAPSGLPLSPPPSTFPSPGTIILPPNSQGLPGQVFDPYTSQGSPLPSLPSLPTTPVQPPYTTAPPNFSVPPSQSFGQSFNLPQVMPPDLGSGYVFGPNSSPWNFGQTASIFGNENQRGSISPHAWPAKMWSRYGKEPMPRLIDHPRARHTWISGNNGHELSLHETEIASTVLIPNFLWSNQPFLFSPGFAVSWWDGPDTGVTGFDMPSKTYMIYANFDTMTDSRRNVGLESSVSVGFYSDFVNWSSDGIRITGTGLLWVRVNPYTSFKVGAEYFNRINVKLLPAVGFFMEPSSDLKIDLYFPRPRFSHRLPKLGNFDVWGYVAAELGGGSWVIERMSGLDDQVDVNEIRAYFGWEWLGPRGVTGFAETGYVFNREMLYRSNPAVKLELQDAVMVRLGFAF